MRLLENQFYHIYNQGNNKQIICKDRNDYLAFLRTYRKYVFPYCDTVAYCIMPNHFHFLINSNKKSIQKKKLGRLESTYLNNGFRMLCSNYATQFNQKYQQTGSLFRQKTKFKNLDQSEDNYAFICFNYIHQNPIRANLCEKLEDWEFSSFRDYADMRQGTLCDKSFAYTFIDISKNGFYNTSYAVIPDFQIKKIF